MATNTIASELSRNMVVEKLTTIGTKKIGFMKEFATDFSEDAVKVYGAKQLATYEIPFVGTLPTVSKDVSTWGDYGATITAKNVGVHLYTAGWTERFNDAIKLEGYINDATLAIMASIATDFFALFSTVNGYADLSANITAATTTETQNQLFKTIYKGIDTGLKKLLICDSEVFALGQPVDKNSFVPGAGFRGFDGCWETGFLPSGVSGVLTNGLGAAIVNRLPDFGASNRTEQVITIPELGGMKFLLTSWATDTGRTTEYTLETIFGAGVLDAAGTKRIVDSGASSSASDSASASASESESA